MANAFEILSLPCTLALSHDEIDQAWRQLSQVHHPDASKKCGNQEKSAELNQARLRLLKPAGLLSEWLSVNDDTPPERNAPIGTEMMDLFASVGASLSTADQVIDAVKKAQTALARSLLAAKSIKAQQEIQQRLGEITRSIQAVCGKFPHFEDAAGKEPPSFEFARKALSELKFLEKWEGECQKRLLTFVELG